MSATIPDEDDPYVNAVRQLQEQSRDPATRLDDCNCPDYCNTETEVCVHIREAALEMVAAGTGSSAENPDSYYEPILKPEPADALPGTPEILAVYRDRITPKCVACRMGKARCKCKTKQFQRCRTFHPLDSGRSYYG